MGLGKPYRSKKQSDLAAIAASETSVSVACGWQFFRTFVIVLPHTLRGAVVTGPRAWTPPEYWRQRLTSIERAALQMGGSRMAYCVRRTASHRQPKEKT